MQIKEPTGGQLEILSRDDLDKIHGATVEILQRLGMKIWEPTALKLFKDAGAEVDEKTMMVRIPESLLKETIRKAPQEFKLYGRDPDYVLNMAGNKVHFGPSGLAVRVHDLEGRVRPGTLKDVGDLARLVDALENIHMNVMNVTPSDVPDDLYHLYVIQEDWKNSVKTTDGYNWTARKAQETIDMASILRGGTEELMKKPCLLGFTNPVSPMQQSKELIEGALVYAKYKQPMVYAPEALAGGTAPATLAGLLAQQNAEVLSGIMISELANPGTPVFYGTVSAALDMKTGATALGGPEVGLINIATGQLGRYYGLPRRGTGGNSDSKTLDAQAGLETATNMLMAGLAGMNFIYDACGSLEGSISTSYEKLVIDNEIAGMVTRVLGGIEVTEETLAVDEICKAGPNASFLGTPFTAKHFRTEHFLPTLLDRRSMDSWLKAGSKDITAVAREKAKKILKEHEPVPMDKGVTAEIEEYVKKTTREYLDR
ncbi:MAG: trimethylamine methyltransferase family protein [Thermoplasmata archaeon]|nr:trimethylamine methyltransferase family protein [Thermoplasmata archaeon]